MSLPSIRSKRHAQPAAATADPEVPVVLPHVVVTAQEHGRLNVVLDGAPVTNAPIGSHALGTLLDEILRTRGVPVRVEIRDADGTSYTDVLTPPPSSPGPESGDATVNSDDEGTAGPRLIEVTADGFVPGEDVALAVILRHSSATGTGAVRHLLDERELASGSEVVVFGRISGTTHVIGDLS